MDRATHTSRSHVRRAATLAVLLAGLGALPALQTAHVSAATPVHSRVNAGCTLANGIQHVIHLEFDNAHFIRDLTRSGQANVPSDLEQMPNLYNFLKNNGVILSNHHTPLISHTSDDIASSESGLYPSNTGIALSANSYYQYTSATPQKQTGFTYWTSATNNGTPNFVYQNGQQPPAPWVPYTRAGCNVGAVAMSGMALENTTDVKNVYGATSSAANDPNKFADYYGVAVHCAAGNSLCATGGVTDTLPNEPGGYNGFNCLCGHLPLTQALRSTGLLTATGNITDINGNTIVDYFNGSSTPGFPGFSIMPEYSLGYVATMQEQGVPVTYAYIITPHNPQGPGNTYGYGGAPGASSGAYASGEANYVAQLKEYDTAFGKFFARLAADGIDKTNTLFVVTSDEQDHTIAENPTPANCDGVTTPCTYPTVSSTGVLTTSFGELATNYSGLLRAEQGFASTLAASATVNSDDAPDIYLNGNPGTSDAGTRLFERATSALTQTNLLTATQNALNGTNIPAVENVSQYMVDQTEYRLLHMYTQGDPNRMATFTSFAQPDYYVFGSSSSCSVSVAISTSNPCESQNNGFNWNHGGVNPDISSDWLGLVGPGVQVKGIDGPDPKTAALDIRSGPAITGTWSDHTDIRPTMMALLGLQDNIVEDGRVLSEELTSNALPSGIAANRSDFEALGAAYKQCNAPLGSFDLTSLNASTASLASGSGSNDSTFTGASSQLASLGAQRDAVAGDGDSTTTPPTTTNTMRSILQAAAFNGTPVDHTQAQSLISACATLQSNVAALAASLAPTATATATVAPSATAPAATSTPTNGGGTGSTPELGSGELVLAGLVPALALLALRRRNRRAAR